MVLLVLLILIFLTTLYFLKTEIYNFYSEKFKKKTNESFNEKVIVENSFSSNTIKDVNYISKDVKGNEYIINASTGEIDINNPDIIYEFEDHYVVMIQYKFAYIEPSDYNVLNKDIDYLNNFLDSLKYFNSFKELQDHTGLSKKVLHNKLNTRDSKE